jgi:hypothetical protein
MAIKPFPIILIAFIYPPKQKTFVRADVKPVPAETKGAPEARAEAFDVEPVVIHTDLGDVDAIEAAAIIRQAAAALEGARAKREKLKAQLDARLTAYMDALWCAAPVEVRDEAWGKVQSTSEKLHAIEAQIENLQAE